MNRSSIRLYVVVCILVLTTHPAWGTVTNTSPSGSGSLSYTGTGSSWSCQKVVSGHPPLSYTYIQVAFSGSYVDPAGASHPFHFTVITSSPGYAVPGQGGVLADSCPKVTGTPYNTIWGTFYSVSSVAFPPVVTSYVVTITFPRGGANSSLTGFVVENTGETGFISPKYKVLGIDYTVPGEQSSVTYTSTTLMGTSTTAQNSFSTAVESSVEICGGAGVAGEGTSVCGTYTNSFTQESDTSSTFAIDQTTAFVNQWFPLTGPALDHGNDVIYVWVNPHVWFTLFPTGQQGPTPLLWNGYTYDTKDDSNNMEVIPFRLSELLHPSTIDAYRLGRLSRAWAQKNTDGSAPGITNQDLATIAGLDPFSDPNYALTIGSDGKTTTDARFTQTNSNGELWYLQGSDQQYKWSLETTDTQGQGGKKTYAEAFAIEVKNSNKWIVDISFDFKTSTTFTWEDQWSTEMSKKLTEEAVIDVHGWTPPYSGPEEFNVFQDNVYGTFMVWGVPGT